MYNRGVGCVGGEIGWVVIFLGYEGLSEYSIDSAL